MKKKMLVITAVIAAALVLPACSGGSSSSSASKAPTPTPTVTPAVIENSAVSEQDSIINSQSSSYDHVIDRVTYSADDLSQLVYQNPSDGSWTVQAVLSIDSENFSEELLEEYLFKDCYPEGPVNDDGFTFQAVVVFENYSGEPAGDAIGLIYDESKDYVTTAQYLYKDIHGLYAPVPKWTLAIQFFDVDIHNKVVECTGDLRNLTDEYISEYIVAPEK